MSIFYNRLINKAFKTHGLSMRPAARNTIKKYLSQNNDDEPASVILAKLIKLIKEKGTKRRVVDNNVVEEMLAVMQQVDEPDISERIQYIGAFDLPVFKYNHIRKVFERGNHKKTLHGDPTSKALILRQRMRLVYQRLMRCEIFAPRSAQSERDQTSYKITSIESLLGKTGKKCIFGVLTQLVEGKYFIEDLNGQIEVKLKKSQITSGLFTENCIVLVEGELKNEIFVVDVLGFPPSEDRSETLTAFPILDCFGMNLEGRAKAEKEKYQKLLKDSNDMVIILSEVHLDKPKVIKKIHVLLTGFASTLPPLFVFIGNFSSTPLAGSGVQKKLKGLFDDLANLIGQFPDIVRHCKFLFIPGPNDLSLGGNILPSPPFPSLFTEKLKKKLGDNFIAGTNPSRILYCTKEMVIFRDNLLQKMRRNCVRPPVENETKELYEQLVLTICKQSHLSPLPMHIRPVYWNYDHALQLYPLPNVLILADQIDQYETSTEGPLCCNPGSFSSDYSFLVYLPGTETCDFSRIP